MKKIIKIQGMHCKSCEIIIKQNIKNLNCQCHIDNISHKKGTISIDVSDPKNLPQIYQAIKKAGYEITEDLNFQTKNSKSRLSKIARLIFAIILLTIFFQTNIGKLMPQYEQINIYIALMIGLVASVSTCLAVTGGIVIGYSQTTSKYKPLKTQILFHLGRILAFVIGGAILGTISGSLNSSIRISIILNILIGLIILYLGLQILGLIPNISKLGFHFPSRIANKTLSIKNPKYAPIVGALTFFLPCGFTQSMQLFALQSNSPIQGAIMMGVFALGTLPVLLALGLGTQYIQKKLKILNPLIASLLIVFGIFTVYNGYQLGQSLHYQYNDTKTQTNIDLSSLEIISVGHDGRQFQPTTIRLKQGNNYIIRVTPYSDGIGCMYALSYAKKTYYIKKGETFDLFVDGSKKRNIPLVCTSMGMRQGIIVIE